MGQADEPLNPSGIIPKSAPTAEQQAIISNRVKFHLTNLYKLINNILSQGHNEVVELIQRRPPQ
jgi:hypothetical protein